MTFLADYSWSRPPPAALKAAGYTAVSRYLSNDPSKNITAGEYRALEQAGLAVMLNWETTTTRALEGAAAGAQDAQAANAQADTVGYPGSAPIYYSVDTGATVDQVRPYFQAVHAHGGRPVGFYGGQAVGLQLLREGVVTHLWVSNAASWSGYPNWQTLRANVAPEAHLIQHLDAPLGFAGQIDHNEILRSDYLGSADMPLTPADAELVAQAVDGKLNRVIGTIQTNLKDVQSAVIAAVNAHVGASGGVGTVDAGAIAKAVADELQRRLVA